MKDLWDSVLKRLSHELSETTINTWFDEVTVVTMEDSAFVLHCSNTFKKSTIEARFLPHIKAALRDLFSTDLEVKILDDQQLAAYHGVAPDRPGDLSESEAFTFETYVVGPQNKLAFAAAKAVTEKPPVSMRAAQSAVKVLRIFLFILGVLHFFGVVVCGFCGVARRGFHARNTAAGKHSGKLMRGKAHGAHKLYDLQVFRFGFLRRKLFQPVLILADLLPRFLHFLFNAVNFAVCHTVKTPFKF